MKINALIVVALLMALAGCSAGVHVDGVGDNIPGNAKSGFVANKTATNQSGVSAEK